MEDNKNYSIDELQKMTTEMNDLIEEAIKQAEENDRKLECLTAEAKMLNVKREIDENVLKSEKSISFWSGVICGEWLAIGAAGLGWWIGTKIGRSLLKAFR